MLDFLGELSPDSFSVELKDSFGGESRGGQSLLQLVVSKLPIHHTGHSTFLPWGEHKHCFCWSLFCLHLDTYVSISELLSFWISIFLYFCNSVILYICISRFLYFLPASRWGQPRVPHLLWQQLWPLPAERRVEQRHQEAQDKLHLCKLQPNSLHPAELRRWQKISRLSKKFKPASPGCWSSLQFWGGGWSALPHCMFWLSPRIWIWEREILFSNKRCQKAMARQKFSRRCTWKFEFKFYNIFVKIFNSQWSPLPGPCPLPQASQVVVWSTPQPKIWYQNRLKWSMFQGCIILGKLRNNHPKICHIYLSISSLACLTSPGPKTLQATVVSPW